MRTIRTKLLIKFPTKSNETIDRIKALIHRGIIVGLDREPNYIAEPKEVEVEFLETKEYDIKKGKKKGKEWLWD